MGGVVFLEKLLATIDRLHQHLPREDIPRPRKAAGEAVARSLAPCETNIETDPKTAHNTTIPRLTNILYILPSFILLHQPGDQHSTETNIDMLSNRRTPCECDKYRHVQCTLYSVHCTQRATIHIIT